MTESHGETAARYGQGSIVVWEFWVGLIWT